MKVPFSEKIGYALGDGAANLVFQLMMMFQLMFYTDILGIGAGAAPEEPALCPKLVRLADDLKSFAEPPKDLTIVDEQGAPLKAGDHARRFFEASWLHFKDGRYHFTYSTGDTHLICEAVSDTLEGPYVYRGPILEPQVGWTTHQCVTEIDGKWYLFHHDSVPSGGRTWLRSLKVKPLSLAGVRNRQGGTI